MGYYTRYNLEWKPMDVYEPKSICGHLKPDGAKYCPECGASIGLLCANEEVSQYILEDDDIRYAVGESGVDGDSCKWYEHVRDMKIMSGKIRNVLFTLKGEGEDSGDIWVKYFLNGKCQECKAIIKYDDFDESKLK